ncbi:MAG TPA: division/cell wall cluster transcriptional repressor MraZ [Allosphingosinicella sp.]
MGRLFSGSGLSAVDAAGRTRLPAFVREAAIGRSGRRRLVFGAHEKDKCIAGFDPAYASVLHGELERRRLAEEAVGIGADAHHARARRLFGTAEEAEFDADGMIELPELPRRRGRISGLALFVGTGGTFEIWDPETARECGGEDLRALAEYRLAEGKMEGDSL